MTTSTGGFKVRDHVLVRFRDDPELYHHRLVLKGAASGKVVATPDREVWKSYLRVGDKHVHLLPFSGQRVPSRIRRAMAYLHRDTEVGRFTDEEFQGGSVRAEEAGA